MEVAEHEHHQRHKAMTLPYAAILVTIAICRHTPQTHPRHCMKHEELPTRPLSQNLTLLAKTLLPRTRRTCVRDFKTGKKPGVAATMHQPRLCPRWALK
jgi:hypothetical protein